MFGQDFFGRQEHGRMVYEDETGLLDLPLPKLIGRHQIENAGVAIAGLRHAATANGWGAGRRDRKRPAHGGMAGAAAAPAATGRWWPTRPRMPKSGWMAATIRMAPRRCRAPSPIWKKSRAAALSDLRHAARPRMRWAFCRAFKGLARHVVTVAIPGEADQPGRGRAL